MQMQLKSRLARGVFLLLEAAGTLLVIGWITRTYLADVVARTPTVHNLELAVKLDPGNSDYCLALARLLEYDVEKIDTARALEHLKRAALLNPLNPQPWLELGAALEFQGRTGDAEACLRRADSLAPNLPPFQLPIGNFFLLHRNVDEAFRHFKVVLAGTAEYHGVLFNMAWSGSGDGRKILDQLIPDQLPTELDFLNYLVSHQKYPEARAVWQRIINNPAALQPYQASTYFDALISNHALDEAAELWKGLRRKGVVSLDPEGDGQNLILNGSFERDVLNMGFDWRIIPVEGVRVVRDRLTAHSPGHSLLIEFPGTQNVDYREVRQYVRVVPGASYHLEGFAKTEGITTDSGPRLEVFDAYSPTAPNQFSEALTGTTNGWKALSVDFTAGPKTELIIVAIARRPSQKLDNLIAGKVWVDDLRLTLTAQPKLRRAQTGHAAK